MLSGAAPLRQAPAARPRRLIYAKSALALAAAATGAFTLGSPAFAQTTPNNGQGSYTATGPQGTYSQATPNGISVTDQTNTGGRLEIDEAQTVTFSGLNINSSSTGQGSFRLVTYGTDLTLTATGAPSTFTTTANQYGINAYSQNALTANLGAVNVSAGSTGIYAYTGYGDVNFTTTGGSVTSTNYQAVTLQAGANLTANLASTVMSGDDGVNAAGNAVNLTNSGQITSGARGINTTAYDGPLSLTNSGVISSQYGGVYAETYGGLLTLNNTAAITSNTYYGIEAYSDNDAMSLTNSGTINSYYSGINADSAGALTANNTGAITSSNSDALDLSGGGDVMLTNGGAISAAQGTGLNVNTSGNIAITNTGAITAGDGLGGDTAGVGIYAFGNGTLNFTSSGGAISGYDGVRLFGGSDVTVNSASAITAGRFGLDAESGQGGAVSVTSSGTIDASNASGGLIAIYAANGTAGTSTVVNVNGAIGGTTAVGTGVEINAASGGPTTNTVNVNANISSMLDGVLVDDAGVTVNVANGVTVSSTGSYGIENDGGGALVVNNNGTITSSGAKAIDSQQDLTLVNRAGGAISSTSGASDTVYARGVANVLNAGSITSSVSSGVVGSVGSVITNATGGSIQGGTDATTGAAVQLTGQSGVVNNYGTLTDGGAGSIIVNNNQASTPAGVVAVNLFAGSTTGAINFANAPNATLSLYNGTGTNNPGVTDTATGVQLQAAGTNSQATVGAVTGAYGLILRGQGDGTTANGAIGTLNLGNFNTATSLTKQDSGTWTVSGTAAYTGATTVTAGTLALANGASIASSSNVALTGATSILDLTVANGAQTINNLSGVAGSQLRLATASSNIFGKGVVPSPISNTINQTTNTIFAGNISGAVGIPAFGGGATLTKAGAGTLTLTGVNSYSGPLTISAGTLALSGSGSVANTSVANAGTFDISGLTNGGASIVSLSGAGATTLGANTLTLTGAAGTVSGVISGSGGGLTVSGGTETLTGANTYTGPTTILAGTLALGGAGSIANSAVVDNTTFDISGHTGGASIKSLSGTGATVLGGNTLTLTSAAGTYSGRASGAGGLTISGGAEALSGANTYSGATTIGAGATLALTGPGGIGSSAVIDNGTFDISAQTTGVTVASLSGTGSAVLGGRTLGLTNAAGTFSGVISGAGGLTIFGGTETLTGANTYTGATIISTGGRLALNGTGSIASSSGVSGTSPFAGTFDISGHTGGATIKGLSGDIGAVLGANTLTLTGGGTYAGVASGTGGLTVAAGNEVLTGTNIYTGATTISGGNLTLGAGGTTGSVAGPISLASGVLTINRSNAVSLAAISGGGSLVQAGTGVTTLTGANTYTGSTAISGGALALGAGGDLSYSSGVVANAALNVSGVNGGYTLIQGLTGASTGTVALGATYLEVSTPVTFAGVISGTGSLQIDNGPASQQGVFAATNTGVSTLTGDNTYTGRTTFAGTLNLGAGGATGSVAGPVTIYSANGSLNVNHSNAVTLGQVISGFGGLQQLGSGTTTITAADTYEGATTITAGTLVLSGAGSIASSAVVDNATFDISGHTGGTTIAGLSGAGAVLLGANTLTLSNGGTFAGVASGTGGLTITAGDEVLTGNNTYTGATTVSGGNLTLGAGGTTGLVAGPIAIASGVLTVNRSDAVSLAAISGGGSLVQAGSGVTTLTGANTYTGSTTISAGTLALGPNATLASQQVALTGASAVFDATALPSLTLADLSGVAGSQVKASGPVTLGSDNSTTFAGALTSTGGLTKVGSGMLTLAGPNGFVGPVAIKAGVLAVSGGSAIPDASVVTVGAGAGFQVLSNETVANIAGSGAIGLSSGAALTFGGDNRASSFATFMGTGDLIKTGTGTFTLNGANTSTGRTTVSGGVLQLGTNARIAGAVTVGSGASLTGSGSVGALTVASGATLSPGVAAGDFGTITAASLNTAGTIRIDFGGNSTGSKSDKIVVAGAINVTGGAIDAHPTSATNDYTFNQYFALTAGTTFTGQFTNSTDFTANPYDPRLKQRIRYDLGPQAVLEVRFLQDLTAGIATTGGGNAGSVALALNGTEQGASDSFSVLINALADQSPGDRQRSLQLLSGEGAVDGQELVTAGLGAFIGVLGSHLADAAGDSAGSASAFGLFDAQGGASSRLGTLMAMSKNTVVGLGVGLGPNGASAPLGLHVWGQGFAVDRRIDSNGGLASTTTSGEGFAAGVDAGLGHGLTVGGAVGYSTPQSKTSGRLAKAQGDSTFGGVYARYAMGPWFGGASFAYGGTSLDLQRSVTVGALTFNPHGKTDAESYGAGFLAGYRFTMRDGSRIDPMVTLDYGHTGEDAYSETNGGVAALRYDSVRLDEVIGTLGARWSKDFLVHGWKVTPDARLAAAVAGGDLGIDTGATFLSAPTGTGSFRTLGAKTPPNWGIAGVGVTLRPLGSSFDVKIGYEGNYASRFTDHHLAATVGYRF